VLYRALADLVLLSHLAFVLFVVLGGLLVLRRPKWAWLHLPCAAWGVLIEYAGWICPLTPWEVSLRVRGGEAGYAGGFIAHYVTAVLYPQGLTRGIQIVLGSLAFLLNAAVYTLIYSRVRRRPSRR
jgi:hypothetical protein